MKARFEGLGPFLNVLSERVSQAADVSNIVWIIPLPGLERYSEPLRRADVLRFREHSA